MKTTVTEQGQIALPSSLRRKDHIRAGQQFEIERLKAGQYLLKKKPEPLQQPDNKGLVDWLLACPEKGWFEPPPRTESTDTFFKEALFAEEEPQPPRRKSRKAKTKSQARP